MLRFCIFNPAELFQFELPPTFIIETLERNMSHSVSWLVENHIVLLRLYDVFAPTEIAPTFKETVNLIETSPLPRVHTIVDTLDVIKMGSLVDVVKELRAIVPSPKSDWTIIVMTAAPLIRWVTDAGLQVTQFRYRRVATIAEALAAARHLDETINWDLLPPTVSIDF